MRINELKDLDPNDYYDFKDQLKSYIYNRSRIAFKEGDIERDNIKTLEQIERRKNFIREKFIEAIGGLPEGSNPLNPQVTGVIQCNGYRIEKIIFESRPKTFVSVNLYVPDGIHTAKAAVLFLCGHHEDAKSADEYQIVCQHLVREGLIVMAQDPVGQGERISYYEKSCNDTTIEWGCAEHTYAGCQCLPLGDSSARYFIHDAMRGIDYLCTRSDVDPAKIGVTGNSGGGTQTSMMMVCEPRLAAAIPATFLMNRETFMDVGQAQDAEQIWPGTSAFGFDHEDILLCMAPRPTLVLAVQYDFFPIEGTKRTVERSKKFWNIYGKKDNFEFFIDDVTHKYTPKMAKKAAEFFSIHLMNNQLDNQLDKLVLDSSTLIQFKPLEHSILNCTKSGNIRGEYNGARFIYEENKDRLFALEQLRKSMPDDELKRRGLAWLKKTVTYNRSHCELSPRHYSSALVEGFYVEMCFWWSQKGIFNHAYLIREYRYFGKEIPVTIAVWDNGTAEIATHIDWIRSTCHEGRGVMVLDVSGTAKLAPNRINCVSNHDFHGTMYKLSTDLIFLDDSIAAIRAYDVVRAIDMAGSWLGIQNQDLRMYGHGKYSLYVLLAASVDERVKNIKLDSCLDSMAEWVGARHYDCNDIWDIILPGALQYFDLPDLKRWFQEK